MRDPAVHVPPLDAPNLRWFFYDSSGTLVREVTSEEVPPTVLHVNGGQFGARLVLPNGFLLPGDGGYYLASRPTG